MKKILTFSLLAFHFSLAISQQHKVDSILNVLKKEKEDTNKVKTLNSLAFLLTNINPDSAITLAQQADVLAIKLAMRGEEANACRNLGLGYNEEGDYTKAADNDLKALQIYEEIKDKQGQINAVSSLGVILYNQGDYTKAIDYDQKALSIAEEIGNRQAEASALGNIGIVYYGQGDYPMALDYYLKALKIKEELGNKKGQANTLVNIGVVYDDEGDHPKALDYYMRAYKIDIELNNKHGQAPDLINIGIVTNESGDYLKACSYYQMALDIYTELGNRQGQAYALGNIADSYLTRALHTGAGNDSLYEKSNEYSFKALKIADEIGDKRGIASHLGCIGLVDTKIGKFKEAEEYLKKAIVLDSTIGEENYLTHNAESLSQLYDTIGRDKQALYWYRKSTIIKDSLYSIDKNKALTRKELTYQFEQKEATAKAEQDKKDATQRIIVWSVTGGLLLVLVFAGFVFRSLNITRKQKTLIEKQKTEVEKQKNLVEEKSKIVEEKNKDILDSIAYAKYLQDAILPPLSLVKQHFPESFLLYKPKDIVAGDFYWMEKSGENILIAACDCTGHGVPGAMVSVVCSNALNRTVKEFKITETGKILDKVRELVVETFEKSESSVQDGMDISLCCINTKTSKVQWSGAYNSLVYIHQGIINEVPADKQPIGKVDNPVSFNTHNLTIPKDSVMYLFTDGYADQFGGEKGKKFKYKQLQELLLANAELSMAEQKKVLEKAFDSWKGQLEQTDDVCIIGVRI